MNDYANGFIVVKIRLRQLSGALARKLPCQRQVEGNDGAGSRHIREVQDESLSVRADLEHVEAAGRLKCLYLLHVQLGAGRNGHHSNSHAV